MKTIQATDLKGLVTSLKDKSGKAALPRNIKDLYLHQIGRDLRVMELYRRGDETKEPYLAGVMYLIFRLLQARMQESGHDIEKLNVNEGVFCGVIDIYQRYIEREIVTRLVGGRNKDDDVEMLQALDDQIAELA